MGSPAPSRCPRPGKGCTGDARSGVRRLRSEDGHAQLGRGDSLQRVVVQRKGPIRGHGVEKNAGDGGEDGEKMNVGGEIREQLFEGCGEVWEGVGHHEVDQGVAEGVGGGADEQGEVEDVEDCPDGAAYCVGAHEGYAIGHVIPAGVNAYERQYELQHANAVALKQMKDCNKPARIVGLRKGGRWLVGERRGEGRRGAGGGGGGGAVEAYKPNHEKSWT
ncbi:hypothetical protein FGB62_24g214 [Gracilaria domingensis]|nr:hypothetical protein FGB62_24g214 [Gracilaria domingensis]